MHIFCDSAIPCTRIYLTDIPSSTQKWHMYKAAHHSIVCFSKTRKQLKETLKNCGSGSQASTCCCSVAQSCLTLCDPVDCSTSGFPVHHQLPELAQTHVHWVWHEFMTLSNHLILCCPLLLLPSTFPSIRVFSNELALRIRGPKYWSFSISPSNEYSELISFRIDSFNLFVVWEALKSLLSY